MSEVQERIIEVVAAQQGVDAEELSRRSPLSEDEAGVVDVLVAIEEELCVELSPDAEPPVTIGEATRAFTIALGDPDPAAVLREHGADFIADERFPEAISLLRESVELDPRGSAGHQLLARAYGRVGEWKKAADAYLFVWEGVIDAIALADTETERSFVSMTQGLTQALIESGQAPKAVEVAERTLAVSSPAADLLYNLACAHARLDDGAATAAALRRAGDSDQDQLADAQGDRDFDAVRSHPAMQKLLG